MRLPRVGGQEQLCELRLIGEKRGRGRTRKVAKVTNQVRLVEVAERLGTPSKLIQRAAEIDFAWLDGVETLGLTAGASAPEILVREVVDALAAYRPIREKTITAAEEKMVFKLPRLLTE